MKISTHRKQNKTRHKRDYDKMKLNRKSNKLVMNILKKHHGELNMELKNDKFISFMYDSCKSAYEESCNTDYSIAYRPVNTDEFSRLQSSFFMDQIFVDEIRKKLNFCYNSSITVKNKTFYITFYTNLNQKINFDKYMKKISLLICLCLSYVRDDEPMTYNITMYATDMKKGLYSGFKNIIESKHVNSGYYYYDPTTSQGNIVLFRKEEWFKVLVHELFHNLNLDFQSKKICYKSMFSDVFFVQSEMLLNEAFVEFWARTINCGIIAYLNVPNITLEEFKPIYNLNINIETLFSMHQAIHLLDIFGLTYEQIIDPSLKASTSILYRENTNAFVYYIVTSIFMYNFDKTIQWFTNNEFDMLKYNKSEREVMIFNYYLKSLVANKKYLHTMKKIKTDMLENTGLRMTIFEMDV